MDEIGAASFVILFFTEDYFKSPYCLHELLEIHRNGSIKERLFPLSIKLDETSHQVTGSSVSQFLDQEYGIPNKAEKGYCIDHLIELQQSSYSTHKTNHTAESIQQRLQQAYDQLVKEPVLERVYDHCGHADTLPKWLWWL